jgi:hypothetical protein
MDLKIQPNIEQKFIHAGGDVVAGDKIEIQELNDIRQIFISLDPNNFAQNFKPNDFQLFSNSSSRNNESLIDVYETIILSKSYAEDMEIVKIDSFIRLAAASVKELKFGEAHYALSKAIPLINEKARKKKIKFYKEYLLTGFIYYSSINDAKGLLSFFNNSNLDTDFDIQKIATDSLQEQEAKELSLKNLKKTLRLIEAIYKAYPSSERQYVANSLGLAYRRIGERGEIEQLDKAISIFNTAITEPFQKSLFTERMIPKQLVESELLNNKGISLVRKYEITKQTQYLKDAEESLLLALEKVESFNEDSIDPRSYTLKPNILNNLGNLNKQRGRESQNLACIHAAFSYYEQSEVGWSFEKFPYFWAIIQKNKAENFLTEYILTQEDMYLLKSIQHCIASIKIRNYENSPYQWVKSVEILFNSISENVQIIGLADNSELKTIESIYIQAKSELDIISKNGYLGFCEKFNATKHLFKII